MWSSIIRFKDITNQRFGRLVAIKRVQSKNEKSFWLFRCDCGSEKAISLSNVQTGKAKSCGCLYLEQQKYGDLTGQKFGLLIAVKKDKKSKSYWLFKCDCGKEKTVNKYNVIRQFVKSCGCLQKIKYQTSRRNIAGQRFSSMIAIESTGTRSNQRSLIWKCLCDCGKTFTAPVSDILRNNHQSCGCKLLYRGENHSAWKGGKYTTFEGYVYVKSLYHPFATKEKYVLEHRLVMEKQIKRYLLPNENVHHINGVRDDNRIENLELWVKCQPSGQRPQDLVAYCLEILKQYAPEMLSIQGVQE